MRLLPEGVAELDPNIRWVVETHLRVFEEVVCGPLDREPGAPSTEEAVERMRRAVRRRDKKAEDEAIVDCTRAEMREWWRDFPERQLLTDLYRRDAQRRAKRGSPDSRRRPSHQEGLRVARGLLADIPDTGPLDAEHEAAAVSRVLAGQGLVSNTVPSRAVLRDHIRRSLSSGAHFDALNHICEDLDNRGKAVTGPLAKWRQEVADGRRRRPAMKPIPPHRPANPAQLKRDIHIQFTIEVLKSVGIAPNGYHVSGCRIVAEALGLPEYNGRTHLESVLLEKVLRARDAEALEGHRRTDRARPNPLRRAPQSGYKSLSSPSWGEAASRSSPRRSASAVMGCWKTARLLAQGGRLVATPDRSHHEIPYLMTNFLAARPSTFPSWDVAASPVKRGGDARTTIVHPLLRRPAHAP